MSWSTLSKYIAITSLCLVAFCCGILFYLVNSVVIDFSVLECGNTKSVSVVLDRYSQEIARFEMDKRAPVSLHDIPPCVIKAFLASEDRTFFTHHGVALRSIGRSLVVNLLRGKYAQGGSTITQQLVRLLFLNARKTLSRKIKEFVYSLIVESRFSKEYILETYLNNVHFGMGIYGVEAACQRFWGISIKDAGYEHAAMLAGIVRASSRYCPLMHPDHAQYIYRVVLKTLLREHHIDQEYYDAHKTMPHLSAKAHDHACAAHIKEMIREEVEKLYGKGSLYREGFVIQTTIDGKAQQCMEELFRKKCASLRTDLKSPLDGAALSLDSKTGAVRVLVGGYSFAESQFNRVTHAKRQMGSIFKPFVYMAAVEKGKTFASIEIDEPLSIPTPQGLWEPRNVNRTFEGTMTLAYALAHSTNTVAIKTFLATGADAVISCARRCGLEGELNPYPSLALGCADATVWEFTRAFNVITSGGLLVEPYMIEWIKDRSGHKIWRHKEVTPRVVMDARVVGQVAGALEATLKRMMHIFGYTPLISSALGKTGTTNDARTCWFAGATPSYTTVVYFGADDNRALGSSMYAVKSAFPVWVEFMQRVPDKQSVFTYHPELHTVTIDPVYGRVLEPHAGEGMDIVVPKR